MPNRPRYDVVLLNDNETPMEFVVRMLELFFDMSFAEGVHTHVSRPRGGESGLWYLLARGSPEKGNRHSGVCDEHKFPLKCVLEEAD
jgi:ATP-dependent Clp protease adaptor protein ClpS